MSERLDRAARLQAEWRRERPDLDVSPPGIIGRVHRIGLALTERLVAVYAGYGLTEAEFDVLASLRRAGPPYERTPGTIADHTMVTGGATSKRLDKLEAEGLVVRRISETDRRRRVVALTPQGLARIDEAFAAHMENEKVLLSVLSGDELRALEPILRHWALALEEQDSQRPAGSGPDRP